MNFDQSSWTTVVLDNGKQPSWLFPTLEQSGSVTERAGREVQVSDDDRQADSFRMSSDEATVSCRLRRRLLYSRSRQKHLRGRAVC